MFDEIHHCSGNSALDANAWGMEILTKIQDHAAYTLALTGTPWRSDSLPISLARYSNPKGKFSVILFMGCLKQLKTEFAGHQRLYWLIMTI
ncbi:hypothetical protein ACPSKX_16265 [Moritella viscosa]